MSSQTAWMINLTLSLCAIILAAGANSSTMHMAASGAVSLVLEILAVREHGRLMASGASKSVVGASTARYSGLIWAWGALGILVTYEFILDKQWPEWNQFFLGFMLAAAGCLLFANMLTKDAATGKDDASVLNLGRILVLVQFIGMMVAAITMLIDGKFPRSIEKPDWAACNIFFFGALSIAAISLNALISQRRA